MKSKPYLQLVRLPNLFTAAADPIAGRLLVGGSLADVAGWGPVAAASVMIYAAGMVLNDLFDLEIDRVERPNRPLPSEGVSKPFATVFGFGLIAVGPIFAGFAGPVGLIVALILSGCVLAYDGGLKKTVFGPEVMGLCRSLNLLLGMTADPRLGGPAGWLAATAFGLFVVGVTWISRSETEFGKTKGLAAGIALQNLALLGLSATALAVFPFPIPSPGRPIVPIEGLAILVITACFVNVADAKAFRSPTPAQLQAAVKTGVLSLIWLDVGLVAAVRGPQAAVGIAALWIPAFLMAKWLYST